MSRGVCEIEHDGWLLAVEDTVRLGTDLRLVVSEVTSVPLGEVARESITGVLDRGAAERNATLAHISGAT